MKSPAIVPLPARPDGPPETWRLPAGKRLSGDPLQSAWTAYEAADGSFAAGVWASGPGCWRVHYTEHEFCLMLEGVSIVTPDGGEPLTLRAGDCFVVPRGFVGTWEVVEPTRKRFVIHEPKEGS